MRIKKHSARQPAFERGCTAEGSRTCLGRPPGPRENILRTVTSTWSAILPFFCHPVQQEGAKAAVLRNGRFQRPYFFALRVVRLI